MPAMVGGFGNKNMFSFLSASDNSSNDQTKLFNLPGTIKIGYISTEKPKETKGIPAFFNQKSSPFNLLRWSEELGPYLAGLIEGDGTFAVHNTSSTAKKYAPHIIVVFKQSDHVFAKFLRDLTDCGAVYSKPNRGYVLWQIQDLVSVFTIVNLINGYMRTPKIEAMQRTITWLNSYIQKSKSSKLPSTLNILSKINPIEFKPLDNSEINSNSWLAGFSDADGNFSISIHQRSDRNSTRVLLSYRLEINQNYHRADSQGVKASFFTIMSKLAEYLGVNVYSRSRTVKDKDFFSFTVVSHNRDSRLNLINYFNKFPLLSSKYLDYKDWVYILELQKANSLTTSYLDKALKIRTDYNSTRTTYTWNHLKNCYLIKENK